MPGDGLGGWGSTPAGSAMLGSMRATTIHAPRDIRLSSDVPDPRIEKPTDVLVRLTTTNIRGSDLHMYEGRTSFEAGKVFGHENLGEVVEVGGAVDGVKKGDRVVMPFNVACGFCENCERGLTGFCLTTNPGIDRSGGDRYTEGRSRQADPRCDERARHGSRMRQLPMLRPARARG